MEPEKKEPVIQEAKQNETPQQAADDPKEPKAETFWEKYKKRQALKKEKEKQRTLQQEIWSWVLTILAAVVIATLIRMFVGEAIRVKGDSMTNTLQNNEIVLVSKLAYLTGNMQRNDIVICRYPGRTEWQVNFGGSLALTGYTLFVKRLVALPGDTVQIKDGKLYVNGELVPDPEYMASVPQDYGPVVLGEDQYFVMGDNRLTSHDSRSADVGPLSAGDIMGKVVRVLIPWRSVE